jgi:hypothetical protein
MVKIVVVKLVDSISVELVKGARSATLRRFAPENGGGDWQAQAREYARNVADVLGCRIEVVNLAR